MACSCSKGCRSRREMRERHGTPHQFEVALERAYFDLMVTHDEMIEANRKYRGQYETALEEVE